MTLTRRSILKQSSLAVTVLTPLSAIGSLRAQSSLLPAEKDRALRFNSNLSDYVADGIGKAFTDLIRGKDASDSLGVAASCSRLLARHIETVGADRTFIEKLSAVRYSSQPQKSEYVASVLRKYDRTIRASDVGEFPVMAKSEFSSAVESLSETGISGWYHNFADALQGQSLMMKANEMGAPVDQNKLKPAVFMQDPHGSGVQSGVYDRRQRAHFQLACTLKDALDDLKKFVSICNLLSSAAFLADVATIASLATCSADALISLGLDAATDGGAAVLTEEEVAICQILAGKSGVIATAAVNWIARGLC